MEDIRFKFVVAKEDHKQFTDILQIGDLEIGQPEYLKTPEDATLVDARFVELIAVIVAGTIAVIALRIFDLILQNKENGTIIDLSKNPPEAILVGNVPYGTLVVIDTHGETSVEKIDPNMTSEGQSLIKSIIEGYIKV